MKINVSVEYVEKNKIKLIVGQKNKIILSEKDNKILASDIYKTFNHKKGNKYTLLELKIPDGVNLDYITYLKECYEMINSIIKDIK